MIVTSPAVSRFSRFAAGDAQTQDAHPYPLFPAIPSYQASPSSPESTGPRGALRRLASRTISAKIILQIRHPPIQRPQESDGKRRSIQFFARRPAHGARCFRYLRRKIARLVIDVHSDSHHGKAPARSVHAHLGEDPGNLPALDVEIVRPLDLRPRPDRFLDGRGQGHRRPSCQPRPLGKGKLRTKEEREPDSFVRSGIPAPAKTSASRGLALRKNGEPAAAALPASLHGKVIRGIGLLEHENFTNESAIAQSRDHVVGYQSIRRAYQSETESGTIFDLESRGAQYGETSLHGPGRHAKLIRQIGARRGELPTPAAP